MFVIAEFVITKATPIHYIHKSNKVEKIVLYSRVYVIVELNCILISKLTIFTAIKKSMYSDFTNHKSLGDGSAVDFVCVLVF